MLVKFTKEDVRWEDKNQDILMMIKVIMKNFEVHWVLVNQGSLVDIVFIDALNKLNILLPQNLKQTIPNITTC